MSRAGLSLLLVRALACCALLVLAPSLAEARAGSSFGSRPSSFGSRGARTRGYNGAQPFSRGPAPRQQSPVQPGFAPGSGNSAYGGSFVQRHPFLTGLAGGLFGSWLFGHGTPTGRGSAGSAIGILLSIVIIAALAWFILRLLRRKSLSPSWSGGAVRPTVSWGTGGAALPADRGRDVNLADPDLHALQRLHAAIQDAWSAGDLARLRRLMTPEMLNYFAEELARNANRGVRNVVGDVHLLKGELSESWEERDLQYATTYLRWRAIDYVVRLGSSPGRGGEVAGGDPRVPVETEEVWTFVRRRGGDWLLSAIQQV
jgi:predicted lipid-binding transport protein (Tim44 family)